MTIFRSPERRKTRQRSGFIVARETTGGECKIKRSRMLKVPENNLEMHFRKTNVYIPELFGQHQGIAAFGGYVYSIADVTLSMKISCDIQGRTLVAERKKKIDACSWRNIGNHLKVEINPLVNTKANIDFYLKLTAERDIGEVHFFGINLDAVKWDDYVSNMEYQGGICIGERFHQKTSLCIPYLYYLAHEDAFHTFPEDIPKEAFRPGIPVLLKSCNRCARFLLIEYVREKQRHLISFGNHCVSRAPCKHGGFGSLKIVYDECLENDIMKPDELNRIIHTKNGIRIVDIYYGYQLECKACKKFYVNSPLNPMRNSTQHREDSLRRRGIEVLVNTLLDNEWIYHKFRRQQGKEFDKFIWEKFDKRCFKCGNELTCDEMNIDHTMPLVALWPLDETATSLCQKCNSEKSDKFPVEFYTKAELNRLAEITGIKRETLFSKNINKNVVSKLLTRIEWFFDEFLNHEDYQKVRANKKAADLIFKAIQNQINRAGLNIDLITCYSNRTGRYPNSITLDMI